MTTAELVSEIEQARSLLMKQKMHRSFPYWILTSAVNLVEQEEWDSKYVLQVARDLRVRFPQRG